MEKFLNWFEKSLINRLITAVVTIGAGLSILFAAYRVVNPLVSMQNDIAVTLLVLFAGLLVIYLIFLEFRIKKVKASVQGTLQKSSQTPSVKRKPTNWENDYGRIKVHAYAQFPTIAIKNDSGIDLDFNCSEHFNDLEQESTRYDSPNLYYCERCRREQEGYKYITQSERTDAESIAISDYKKWLKDNMSQF